MNDYQAQRRADWSDPRKRAVYLAQDTLELRQHFTALGLERVRQRIKLRYAAMVAAGTLAPPPGAHRPRRSARSTIWRR